MNEAIEEIKVPVATSSQPTWIIRLLGIYLAVVAGTLAFLIYVFWPTIKEGNTWDTTLRVFQGSIDSDTRLLILVMLTGGLGSYVHAATSFVTYVGNKSLVGSWTWWYVLRPQIGMALALLFYFVIRGGLMSAGAGAEQVSAFGIAAVSGLVGMFSKQATDKLREVFDNLFRTEAGKGDDQRRDKVSGTIPVTQKMIPMNKITAFEIGESKTAKDVKILEVFKKYGGIVTRLPIVDRRGVVLHVIHEGLTYKFISRRVADGGASFDLNQVTLHDFLEAPEMRALVTDSLAFVAATATLADAKAKMDATPKCQDIFVTEHGLRDEPVKGWLTNVDLGPFLKA